MSKGNATAAVRREGHSSGAMYLRSFAESFCALLCDAALPGVACVPSHGVVATGASNCGWYGTDVE